MFAGLSKGSTQNAANTDGGAGGAGGVKSSSSTGAGLIGGLSGVLGTNMGNILAGAPASSTHQPGGPLRRAQTKAGSTRSVAFKNSQSIFGGGPVARNKLGATSINAAGEGVGPALHQRGGNPTGTRAATLQGGLSTNQNHPHSGRGLLAAAHQALGGGVLPGQPGQKVAPTQNKVFARPAQRFKIRKDTAPKVLGVSNAVNARRPFAGKAVEVTTTSGPSGACAGPDETDQSIPVQPTPSVVKELKSLAIGGDGEVVEKLEDDELPAGVVFLKLSNGLLVRDIDASDGSPQLVPEYIKEITSYLFNIEKQKFNITERFLDNTKLTGRMRAILLDWLVQVHINFGFKQETMFIASSILDRFLALDSTVERTELQCVGVASLFIAVKFEEISVPRIQDFANVSDNAFDTYDLLAMERRIFSKIQFDLSMPIPTFFLRRCSKAAAADINVHQLAKYIAELGIIDYNSCHIRPSMLAAASLALAMMLLHRKSLVSLWTPTVEYYSRYSLKEIIPIIEILATVVRSTYESDGNLKGVRRKFAHPKFFRVSTLPRVNPEDWKAWIAHEFMIAKAKVNKQGAVGH